MSCLNSFLNALILFISILEMLLSFDVSNSFVILAAEVFSLFVVKIIFLAFISTYWTRVFKIISICWSESSVLCFPYFFNFWFAV